MSAFKKVIEVVRKDRSTTHKEIYAETEGDFAGSIYLRRYDLPNPVPQKMRVTFEAIDD